MVPRRQGESVHVLYSLVLLSMPHSPVPLGLRSQSNISPTAALIGTRVSKNDSRDDLGNDPSRPSHRLCPTCQGKFD